MTTEGYDWIMRSGNEFSGREHIVEKLEIIGRDKIEQYGAKPKVSLKNIQNSKKKWFSMDNPIVWFIFTIIVLFVGAIIKILFSPELP